MKVCEYCGQEIRDSASTVEKLRSWCEAKNYVITADGAVSEEVAAEILGIAPGTLANKRRDNPEAWPARKHGRTSRVYYKLEGIAAAIDRISATTGDGFA